MFLLQYIYEPKQGLPAKNGCSLSSERPLARAPAISKRAMSTLAGMEDLSCVSLVAHIDSRMHRLHLCVCRDRCPAAAARDSVQLGQLWRVFEDHGMRSAPGSGILMPRQRGWFQEACGTTGTQVPTDPLQILLLHCAGPAQIAIT